MVALKIDCYSLTSIHKPASKAMLFDCLMILDHLSGEVEVWTFETISQQEWMQFQNFKCSLLAF